MRHLDAEPAHVVGHSYGAAIALQLALDTPAAVRSLSLLEPPLFDVPSGPKLLEEIIHAGERYEAGDNAAAVDTALLAVCGENYRASLDAAVPGGFDQAVSDAGTVFAAESPAFAEWTFTREDAARIKQRVLSVLGANTDALTVAPVYGEIHARLLDWFPQAKPLILPDAGHFLQVENPHAMAVGLADFFSGNREDVEARANHGLKEAPR